MTILDIYSNYNIPPNLQRHQLEVASVGRYICEHWQGPKVDKELVTEALLLHDMGNIIKFKRPFLGELEKDAVYWEQIQDKFIKKYGKDVHTATMAIVAELGLQDSIGPLLENMRLVNADARLVPSSEVRILEYADCCVTPSGITGFEARIQDLMDRYHHGEDEEWISLLRTNAKIVQEYTNQDLSKLSSQNFSQDILFLQNYEIV